MNTPELQVSPTFHVSVHEAGHCVVACLLGRGKRPKRGADIIPRKPRNKKVYEHVTRTTKPDRENVTLVERTIESGGRLGIAYTKNVESNMVSAAIDFGGVVAELLAGVHTEHTTLDGDLRSIIAALASERIISWDSYCTLRRDENDSSPEIMRLWSMACVAAGLATFGPGAAGFEDTPEYRFMVDAVAAARKVLSENFDTVMRVVHALEERKTLSGPEVEKLVRPDLVGRIYKRPRRTA